MIICNGVIGICVLLGGLSHHEQTFRVESAWVSSDMLMMLRFSFGPEARGLVRSEDSAMWRFPSDYIERLSAAVAQVETAH